MELPTVSLKGMIDSHFHLSELAKRGVDPLQVLCRLEELGFGGGMDIGIDADDAFDRIAAVAGHPLIRIAAGIGPWGAQEGLDLESTVERAVQRWRTLPIDCIGEIGLDFHWNYGTVQRQLQLFELQLDAAQDIGLPVAIHSRNADEALLGIISKREFPHGGILHCFSSSLQVAKTAWERNLMISFAGPVTYKNSSALTDVLCRVPDHALLVETDSPYLPPQPMRGKTNTPEAIVYVYQRVAQLRAVPLDVLVRLVGRNFERVIGPIARHAALAAR